MVAYTSGRETVAVIGLAPNEISGATRPEASLLPHGSQNERGERSHRSKAWRGTRSARNEVEEDGGGGHGFARLGLDGVGEVTRFKSPKLVQSGLGVLSYMINNGRMYRCRRFSFCNLLQFFFVENLTSPCWSS